ncbi:glucosaminidase domain-containing protein [Stigmatella sp. ncwal1]|uniref:Peptidoglycan hydrolase n=1 Tax=Stigmatella ashevillensis TaxID=2995309 RepID=A0ABT5DF74_9BACT|nr:glucosaminidase domain-containing protein [Stigmatella ashevillena]MDC0712219.1 glucosaminidase domain-containing protein [Stigmatella ashevillena]
MTTTSSVRPNTYAVRSGDTINKLAERFGTTPDALAAKNGLSDANKIKVGQKLVLPDGFDAAPAAQTTRAATSTPTATTAGAAGPVRDSNGREFPTSRDGTPLFKQGDAEWGKRTLGTSSSVGAAGCAMTATAMAVSKISGKTINPGQMDAWLDKNGGYSGNGLNWDKAAQMGGLHASSAAWNLDTINKQVDAGRPVVVGVDYKAGSNGGANGTDHWIAITGRGQEGGKPVYYANDPATGKQITLSQDGNTLKGGPQGYKTTGQLRTFSGGNPPRPGTSTQPAPGGSQTPSTGGTTAPTPTAPAGGNQSLKGTTLPNQQLKRGSEGAGVEKLQDALVKLGYMTKAQVATGPGTFGPKTEAALKKFQKDHGVDAIGEYGPKTRAAFEKLGAKIGGATTGTPSTGTPSTGTPSTGGVTGPLPKTGNAFMDSMAADAIKSQRETGVPASVTLAQAALESGWGKSGLSTKGNNFFGIKGEGPAGHVTMPTKEHLNGKWVTVDAAFRKYNSPSESFADHGNFLRKNKRYAEAFNHTDNAARFAQEIHKAGYATDPEYSNKLTAMIKKYGLERFDAIGRQ